MEVLKYLKEETLPCDTLDFKESMIWIAYDGKQPVGFAGMRSSSRWENCGYLNFAGVIESHQGLGIQKKLIRARIQEAKRLGWEFVFSDTWRNPPAENSLS